MAHTARARTQAAQRKLRYASVLHAARKIPAWMDNALRMAVHPDPNQGHETRSEFEPDLRQPHQAFLNQTCAPLADRHPVLFWQGLSAALAAVIVWGLMTRCGLP